MLKMQISISLHSAILFWLDSTNLNESLDRFVGLGLVRLIDFILFNVSFENVLLNSIFLA